MISFLGSLGEYVILEKTQYPQPNNAAQIDKAAPGIGGSAAVSRRCIARFARGPRGLQDERGRPLDSEFFQNIDALTDTHTHPRTHTDTDTDTDTDTYTYTHTYTYTYTYTYTHTHIHTHTHKPLCGRECRTQVIPRAETVSPPFHSAICCSADITTTQIFVKGVGSLLTLAWFALDVLQVHICRNNVPALTISHFEQLSQEGPSAQNRYPRDRLLNKRLTGTGHKLQFLQFATYWITIFINLLPTFCGGVFHTGQILSFSASISFALNLYLLVLLGVGSHYISLASGTFLTFCGGVSYTGSGTLYAAHLLTGSLLLHSIFGVRSRTISQDSGPLTFCGGVIYTGTIIAIGVQLLRQPVIPALQFLGVGSLLFSLACNVKKTFCGGVTNTHTDNKQQRRQLQACFWQSLFHFQCILTRISWTLRVLTLLLANVALKCRILPWQAFDLFTIYISQWKQRKEILFWIGLELLFYRSSLGALWTPSCPRSREPGPKSGPADLLDSIPSLHVAMQG